MMSPPFQFHCVPFDQLTSADRSRWETLRLGDETLRSPYFHPEFTRCVGEVRSDVEVAIIESSAGERGYFPFQRQRRIGRPVGGRLSDFQGMVASPANVPSGPELLRGCRLDCYDFDHWLGWQSSAFESVFEQDEVVSLDLSAGWSGYTAALRDRGSAQIAKAAQKERSCERQFGPMRFEPVVEDASLLELLFRWKSRQYRETGITDVFAFPWTRELVRTIHSRREGDFRGMLSALRVGERVVALHFGMRAGSILHAWFPAFDPEFGRFSPGASLWCHLALEASGLGITRIDLGRASPWKRRFSTCSLPVVAGSCDLRPVRGLCRRWWRSTKSWVKQSPLRWPARVPGAVTYRLRDWLEFR